MTVLLPMVVAILVLATSAAICAPPTRCPVGYHRSGDHCAFVGFRHDFRFKYPHHQRRQSDGN
jgi:hypothetical protein